MLNCKVILDAIQIKPGITQKESLSFSFFQGQRKGPDSGFGAGIVIYSGFNGNHFFFNFYWLSLVFVAHDSFIFNVFFLNTFIWVKKK